MLFSGNQSWLLSRKIPIEVDKFPINASICKGLYHCHVRLRLLFVQIHPNWFVVSTPLKNISRMIIPNIWKTNACSKPPISQKNIHHSFSLAKLQTPQPSHILLSRVKGHWNVSTTRLQVDVTMLTSMPEGQRWMLDAMPSWWQLYALAILNMLIFAELIYI